VERLKVPGAAVREYGLGLVAETPRHSEALVEQLGLERQLIGAAVGTHEVVGRDVVPVAEEALRVLEELPGRRRPHLCNN